VLKKGRPTKPAYVNSLIRLTTTCKLTRPTLKPKRILSEPQTFSSKRRNGKQLGGGWELA
jgi:hypothetical protein